MKRSKFLRLARQRPLVTVIGLILASLAALGYRLFGLAPGLASAETALPPFRSTVAALWNQPLEAPLLLVQLVVAAISQSTGVVISRLPNVLLGITLVLVCFWLIQRWYGYRLAMFSMLLLITAPWFLHISRIATSDIVYPLAMALVMVLAALWHKPTWRLRTLYSSLLITLGLLYVPGAIWLLLVVAGVERKQIVKALQARPKHSLAAGALGVVGLVPLLHSLIASPVLGRQLIGLPAQLPSAAEFVVAFGRSWQYLFIGGFSDPVRNLGQLALVNAFTSLSFIIGIYLYSKHPKAARSKQLLGLWLVGSALVALGGPVSYSLVLPIIVVLSIGGLGYLLHLWLRTFPHNPYARGFGIGLLGLVVLFAVAYNIRSYYLAWPNTPAVRAAFTRQL